MRRVLCHIGKFIFLSFMLLILSSAGSITAKASIEYDKVIEMELVNKKYTDVSYSFPVDMDSNCKHLSNVRTSSKFLKAKIVKNPNIESYGDDGFAMSKAKTYFTIDTKVKIKPMMIKIPISQDYGTGSLLNTDNWNTFTYKTVEGY